MRNTHRASSTLSRVALASCLALVVVIGEFGRTTDGQAVDLFALHNANGLAARVMTHGATLIGVDAPDRVSILIWERGVGPTQSSGTGTCAAAVAAACFGNAQRTMDVEAPGGTQHVEWLDDGLWLTGWADVLSETAYPRRLRITIKNDRVATGAAYANGCSCIIRSRQDIATVARD